jgi:hypothetical protein
MRRAPGADHSLLQRWLLPIWDSSATLLFTVLGLSFGMGHRPPTIADEDQSATND